MSSDVALMLSISAGVIALIYGAISVKWILAQSAGNQRMQEIASAIREGATCLSERGNIRRSPSSGVVAVHHSPGYFYRALAKRSRFR